jgi:aldehyde:ferredoxin oxidoreductase
LERLFNLREGFGKQADTLPKRFTDEPLPESKKNSKVPIGKMLPKYYKLRGWDADGVPRKKTLKKLGLDFAVPVVVKQSTTTPLAGRLVAPFRRGLKP